MTDPNKTTATPDDEDFICIINEVVDQKEGENCKKDENVENSFELLDATHLRKNHFLIEDKKLEGPSLFLPPPDRLTFLPLLSTSSILGTKASNISLNIDTVTSEVASGFADASDETASNVLPPLSARSYSAESLTFFGDDHNYHHHLHNKNSSLTSSDSEREQNKKIKQQTPVTLNSSSSLSSKPLNKLANFGKLQQWIYCIAVVNFDIEIGQSIECLFPRDAHLTERETSNICYLSFPDSNSGCMGDTQFHFRTRACASVQRPAFERHRYADFNATCLQVLQVEKGYLHGYVYFRQVKDVGLKRGYFQKSLVVLSWFPFVPLFSRALKVLAPKYFELDVAALEAACSDINRWPPPTTGQILTLPFLGTVLQVLLPDEKYNYASMCQPNSTNSHFNLKKYSTAAAASNSLASLTLRPFSLLRFQRKVSNETPTFSNEGDSGNINETEDDFGFQHLHLPPPESPSRSPSLVVNVVNDINIYRALLPVIAHVQVLWELVLTCEPLAVITGSPRVCSEVVHALVHTISPLKYGADYRPFFTIHDSEFKEYTGQQTRSPPPVILGVTNPFFVKTLAEWPHLIKISDFINEDDDGAAAKKVNMNSTLKKSTNSSVLSSASSLDIKTGVYTKYRPFLTKDREILKKLLKGIDTARPLEAQNALLRRFFIELTQSFLIPLERYFAGLMPLARNLSPFKRPPTMGAFRIEDFIGTLDATGPQLTTGIKGDWVGLYRRFLRSPNYVAWYSARSAEATDKLRALHIEAIADSNLASLVAGRPEVEVVDLILKLKENIRAATNGTASRENSNGLETSNGHSGGTGTGSTQIRLSTSTVDRLRSNLRAIVDVLPEDSRALFGGDSEGGKMVL